MRIFVLGDSYCANLFDKTNSKYNTEIEKYLNILKENNIDKPLWWTDWLEQFGYEIYNFGISGCSIEDVLYQFSKIDINYKEGDRIIIHLPTCLRYNWYDEKGDVKRIQGFSPQIPINLKEEFTKQCINRENSFKFGYLNNYVKLFNYLLNLHDKYSPLLFSFFDDIQNVFFKNDYYIAQEKILGKNNLFEELKNENKQKQIFSKLSIYNETNGKINDHHLGRYGNYYFALIIYNVLKSNLKSNYLKDENLRKDIINKILIDNILFINPKNLTNII